MSKSAMPRQGLIAARNEKHLSQLQLADLLGTTPLTVSRWERGLTTPGPYYRRKLVAVFGMTEYELELVQSTLSSESFSLALQYSTSDAPIPIFVKPSTVIDPYIPLPTSWRLFGREHTLTTLKAQLRSGDNYALCALRGLPGIGKTALAISLAHDPEVREMFPDGVLWAALGPDPNLLRVLSRWGSLLGILEIRASELSSVEAWALELRTMIGQRTMLIVEDDVWRLEDALALKVGGPQCSYLLTTRSRVIAAQFASTQVVQVSELSEHESLTLLANLAGDVVLQEREAALALVRAVGALPLALVLIGHFMRVASASGQPRRVQAALTYLQQVEKRLRLSEPQAPLERHSSLSGEQRISLQAVIAASVERLPAPVQAALLALSVFPPKPHSFSEEAALAVAASALETLDTLSDTGLLESIGPGRYTLHQTIADFGQLSLQQSQRGEAVRRFVTYYSDFVRQHSARYEALERESSNVFLALETALEHEWWPQLISGACAFAPFLLARGLYTSAEQLLQQAYKAATQNGNTADRIRTLLFLGQLAHKQGNFALAETSFLQQGLFLAREHGDAESTIALITDLSWVLDKRGKYQEAETLLQEGLELASRVGNKEHLCGLLKVLGSVAADMGDLAGSEHYLRRGLALARELEDPELVCVLLINLGATLAEAGNSVEANQSFLSALDLAQGLAHQEYLSLIFLNLCDGALAQGDLVLAEHYAQTGLPLSRAIFHREWMSILLANLGIIRRSQGQYEQAETYFQEALTFAYQIDRPSLTCSVLYEFGSLRLDQRLAEEADSIYHSIIKLLPENAPGLRAMAQYGMARAAALRGNLAEARCLGLSSLSTFETMGHHLSKEVQNWLSGLPT